MKEGREFFTPGDGHGASMGRGVGSLLPMGAAATWAWYGVRWPALLGATVIDAAGNDRSTIVLLCFGVVLLCGLIAVGYSARRRELDRTAAERVAAAAQQYRLLFESNPHPMWVFDRETLEFRAINDMAVAHYGYSQAEFLAMTVADICPPEDVAPLVGDLSRSWGPARFYTGSWRHRRKDGTLIDVEITANALNFEGRFSWVVLVHDVTVRKRAREATRFLAEAGEVLASSLDYETTLGSVARLAVPHIADFCVIDMIGAEGSINRVAVVHINPAKEELVRALWHRNPLLPDGLQPTLQAIRTGQSQMTNEVGEETFPAARDPEHRRIIQALGFKSLMVVPLVARGRTLGAIALGTSEAPRLYGPADLSLAEELARRAALAVDNARLYHEAEEARRESETANRAKDRFLAMLSHELRTPLAPVLMTTTAMLEAPARDPTLTSALEMIRRNIELEARLIDDLLDVTRISQGKMPLKPERVDSHSLIRRALEICRGELHSGGLRLELDLAATTPYVHADPARLQQVFWNLFKNAVKFTPAGGTLSIRSRNEAEPDLGPVTQRLIIEIRDTGIGIEPHVLPRIFDAFEQGEESIARRFGGLGLGLAISRAVVEAHGGSLKATSAGKDQGTTFTVALATTLVPAAEDTPLPSEDTSEPPHRALKILLVDDNRDTLQYLACILGQQGHTVQEAKGLYSALETAEDEDFDLIISDIELPDGTGLELMSTLGNGRRIPGIALSGFGTYEDIEMSKSVGFSEHLTKPVDFRTLMAAIQRVAPPGGQLPLASSDSKSFPLT